MTQSLLISAMVSMMPGTRIIPFSFSFKACQDRRSESVREQYRGTSLILGPP